MEKNKFSTLRDLWEYRVKRTPYKEFLIADEAHFTYSDIDKLAENKAMFMSSLGIKTGDIVSLQFELDISDISFMIACMKIGAVINPINPRFDISEIKNLVYKLRPRAIFAQQALRGRDTLFNVDQLFDYKSFYSTDLRYFIRQSESSFAQEYTSQSPALILNTSGTTGSSKGVVLTNSNILSAEIMFNDAFNIVKSDMIGMPSGLYHAIGFHHGLISTILAGSSMVIMRHYSAEILAQEIKQNKITYIDSVPTVIYDLLFRINDLGQIRQLICSGDKLHQNLLEQAKKRKIPLYNCYGLTEAVPFSYTPSDYFKAHNYMVTALKPMEGMTIKLLDANEKEILEKNKCGTIWVKGPTIFEEYYLEPKKTRKVLKDRWFNTEDYGHYNDDGLLEVDGRSSDKIIRGGENISASFVEEKIRECKNITDVAVVGVPDVRLGQKIGAFIITDDKNLDKDRLIKELIQQKVEKKFWPEKLYVVKSIPKTATGKVRKYLLKQGIKNKIYYER